jgi:ubiquinone biosynthesis protein UbiJ
LRPLGGHLRNHSPHHRTDRVHEGEQLLHGYDIAQALDVEWPIGDQPARLTVQAVLPVLPALVDSEAATSINAAYELAIDGCSRMMVRFRDCTASIGPAEGTSIDCQLSGDPVAWLLALYGRVSWEQLLRTGRVRVTSGDAGLGEAFKQLLRNP